jgi:predicted RNA-binding protein with PIN domain
VSIVRILVDGYSLLHKWPQLAPGKKRHTEAARDALIETLTRYRDAIGTPITVVFDGAGAPKDTPKAHSTREFEVLFSRKRKTADDIIERATHRLIEYGEVLVVTDDYAERDTVAHLGALTSSCAGFIENVDSALGSMTEDIANFNRRERKRFQRQGAK